MPAHYILIGASAASMGALHKLRQVNPGASVSIFSAEKELPYNKCLLADFLAGIHEQERLAIYRPAGQAHLYLNTQIVSIDPAGKTITTQAGIIHAYDHLLLGMGSGPWIPPIAGVENQGVFTFHTLADTLAIKEYVAKNQVKNAVIIGAGLSGLEAADALAQQGIAVTVVEKADRVLPTLLSQKGAEFLSGCMAGRGIGLRLGSVVDRIESADQKVTAVVLADGTQIPACLVIVATGLRANTDLCRQAGIACGSHGVIVDGHMRTNQPYIYAAGDLIEITDMLTGNPIRSCMWPDAMQQGMHAALAMAGQPKAYPGASVIVSSAFFGLKFARAGIVGAPQTMKVGDFYHEISQKEGILQGFTVLGTRHDLGLLRRLILTKQPLLDSLDSLFE